MNLIEYQPGYQHHFDRLNRAWITRFFEMEAEDEAMLLHPQEHILDKGGRILFAQHEGNFIGTIALIPMEEGVFELAKMAVDESFQGLGAGKFLCSAALEEARRRGARKVILFTNSGLATALHIYHRFGFRAVPTEGSLYRRADTKMEVLL